VGALIAYCSAVSASIAAAAALVSAGLPVDALIAIF
jgi:rhodanese-related sulfurtransferase